MEDGFVPCNCPAFIGSGFAAEAAGVVEGDGAAALLACALAAAVVVSGSANKLVVLVKVGLTVLVSTGECGSLELWESFVRFFLRKPSVGMNAAEVRLRLAEIVDKTFVCGMLV